MDINYRSDTTAIVSDLRSSYSSLGIHPEWRKQFVYAINNSKFHAKLDTKLAPFGKFVVCYTKIMPNKSDVLKLLDFDDATICIISSVGEHNMTPWMIIHNIGHTIISNNLWVKKEIKQVLGLKKKYRIAPIQDQLVRCASAREGIIPNINELIYELYTTWVWSDQKTQSDHTTLREYCDMRFPSLMADCKNTMFWHRFRCPVLESSKPLPWLAKLLDDVKDEKPPLAPGIPGYSNLVLKAEIENA